jgi:hypothetical protein
MRFGEFGSFSWVSIQQQYYSYMGKGRGYHLPAFLALPLPKCVCQKNVNYCLDIVNDTGDPLIAL